MRRLALLDRRKRAKSVKHLVEEVLTCIILGYLAGRKSRKAALEWCRNHLNELRRYMPLENGIASEASACRILQQVDNDDLIDIFIDWAASLVSTENTVLISDGKGVRAAASKIQMGRTPYCMNLYDQRTGLCVATIEVGAKENEKTAIHQLLKKVSVKGSLFLADAIATDGNIMVHLVNNEADFLLQVKRNNPEMYKELFEEMGRLRLEGKAVKDSSEEYASAKEKQEVYSHYSMGPEMNRDRVEYRECWTSDDASLLNRVAKDLPFIKTIGTIEQVRILKVKDEFGNDITPTKEEFIKNGSPRQPVVFEGDGINDAVQRIGVISSKAMNARETLSIKRSYWSIENNLHKKLDDNLSEDRDVASVNWVRNVVLRKFAYNLVRIAQMREWPKGTMATTVHNKFCDDTDIGLRYVMKGIAAF